ncbi:MAG: hypothetical protein JNN07_00455 [Verrucomicrobiales bacterium]|nr:hypothetical protein [Verrucomicrobiales bacterium]
MSEYQYYEFAAIDGPISDAGLRYAQGCSSSAEVSRVRWQNTYNYGDFRGSVDTLLKHYDAHFYIANWGTVRLGLAFPKGVFSPKALKPYLQRSEECQETLRVKETTERCILYWERDEEGGGGWEEGEGILDELIGVRDELMRGDYRALFLGWLAGFVPEEWVDSGRVKVSTPPIPDGLNQLSPAQKELLEHFPVDPDALATAAQLSPGTSQNCIPIAKALERLSDSEMRVLLGRVAEGGGPAVRVELQRLTFPKRKSSPSRALRCVDFAAKVIEARSTGQPKGRGSG